MGWVSAIFAFFLPFVYSRGLFYAGTNAKYFYIILFSYFVFCVAVYRIWTKKADFGFFKKPLFLSVVGLLLLQYMASFSGIFPELSFWSQILRSTGTFFFTHIVLLALVFAGTLKREDWTFLRRTVVVSSGLFSFLYFFGTQGLKYKGIILGVDFSLNGLSLGNETFAGAYVLLGIVLTFVEIFNSKSKREKLFYVFLLCLQMLSPLILNFKIWTGGVNVFQNPIDFIGPARASSVLAFALVFYVLIYQLISKIKDNLLRNRVTVAYNSLLLFGVVLSVFLLFTPGSFVQKKYIDMSTEARIILWDSSWKTIKERPVLGYGPETFRIATQKNFDNRLNLKENMGEIWFDKAHNYFLDSAISTGFLGLAVSLLVFALSFLAIKKAFRAGKINKHEYVLMSAFILIYILQLQTSFETVATYFLLAFLLGYSMYLENGLEDNKKNKGEISLAGKILSGVLCLVIIFGLPVTLKESKQQHALVNILRTKESEFDKRASLISMSLDGTSSFESIRVTSISFLKGVIEKMSKGELGSELASKIVGEMNVYEKYYKQYLEMQPNDYRARMNLAYLYFVKTFLGSNSLKEAHAVIEGSYELSPNNPLTYQMDSLSYLYEGNIKKAKEISVKGAELNTNIEYSKEIFDFLLKQEKSFPEIEFLRIGNL